MALAIKFRRCKSLAVATEPLICDGLTPAGLVGHFDADDGWGMVSHFIRKGGLSQEAIESFYVEIETATQNWLAFGRRSDLRETHVQIVKNRFPDNWLTVAFETAKQYTKVIQELEKSWDSGKSSAGEYVPILG